MKEEVFSTAHADYRVRIDEAGKQYPWALYLHGGPGLNSRPERQILGRFFHGHLNFIWLDLLGGADSPARTPDALTWPNQVEDVLAIVNRFAPEGIHLIGHCLGVHTLHDVVRAQAGRVKSATWISPAHEIAGIFKGIFGRALLTGRLSPLDLSAGEQAALVAFLATPVARFARPQVELILAIFGRIRDVQGFYWSNREAEARFAAESILSLEAFQAIQTSFFEERPPSPLPDYRAIPLLAIYAEGDQVAPWDQNGRLLLESLPAARVQGFAGEAHWIHLQQPAKVSRIVIDFIKEVSQS